MRIFVLIEFFSIFVLMLSPSLFAHDLAQTRIVTFLGERYGVFYQWSNFDENQFSDHWREAHITISEELLNSGGKIVDGKNKLYNSIANATSELNNATINIKKPIYLNEIFISEIELDLHTRCFPEARDNFIHDYSEKEFQFARVLRTSHQFSGIGMDTEELLSLEKRVLKNIDTSKSFYEISNKLRTYLNSRIKTIQYYRAQSVGLEAKISDSIVQRMSSSNNVQGKYRNDFDKAWYDEKSNVKTMANPVRSQNTLKLFNGVGNFFSFAGLAISVIYPSTNPYIQIEGLDCSDTQEKLNRLICKWEKKYDPANNNVQCTIVRNVIPKSEDACIAIFDVMLFTVEDKNSKTALKDSAIFQNGILIGKQPINELTLNFQKKYKVMNLRFGNNFTSDGSQYN